MNSSLKRLVKNLLDYDFKYLTQEFGSKNLELLKQKDANHMSTQTVLKDLVKKKYLRKNIFVNL